MRQYLVFSVPAAAAVAALVLWLLLPTAQLDILMAEAGLVENWTLFAYGAAIVAACACFFVAQDKLAAAAFVVVLAFLGAREMDLHVSLTGTSVLRLSYYLRGTFTAEKAAALATLALFAICAGCLWLRQGLFLRRDLKAGEPVAIAAMAFFTTVVIAKVLDRAPDVLAANFGLPVPRAMTSLMQSWEETLELALPLIVVMAAVQYVRARRLAIPRLAT